MGGGDSWPVAGGGDSGESSQLILRKAHLNDLDAIVDIILASFPDDPGCDYKFPYRHRYPEDFRHWTGVEYGAYLRDPDKFAVMVVTTASDDRPIAVGVWDLVILKDGPEIPGAGRRRDANDAHVAAYTATLVRSAKTHFARFGPRQFHLWCLYTHPDFRRRGAGTTLCRWAEGRAPPPREGGGGWALTVLASPMGRALYEYLGYGLVGSATARVGDEAEHVVVYVLEKILHDGGR